MWQKKTIEEVYDTSRLEFLKLSRLFAKFITEWKEGKEEWKKERNENWFMKKEKDGRRERLK